MQAGADPENFSRGGGPTLSKIDSVWRITVEVSTNMKNNYFLISSNIGDIKFCKFQGGPDAPDFPSPLDPCLCRYILVLSYYCQSNLPCTGVASYRNVWLFQQWDL